MCFVYCEKCGWTQDDFWSPDGYNPMDFLNQFKKDLFGDELDRVVTVDDFDKETGKFIGQKYTKWREIIADDFEMFAKRIRNQKYITREQFLKENPEWKCPLCGNRLEED
jgi:rubrerythrin